MCWPWPVTYLYAVRRSARASFALLCCLFVRFSFGYAVLAIHGLGGKNQQYNLGEPWRRVANR